jgi:Protein of unknown function (DUF4239)
VIEAWLDLPVAGVFAVLTLLYAATAVLIAWLSYGPPLWPRVRKLDGVVAPFFGAVGILFALLTGFLAGDIADRNRQASRVVQAEVAELRNVHTLSVASASDMRDIRAAWTRYVSGVVRDEWPAMTDGASSAAVGTAYEDLLREVSDPKIATQSGAPVQSALLAATVRVGTARSERLALASDSTSALKWEIVLILGVMTQISIGLVHLQRRNAQFAALAVFSVAAVIALGLLGLQEYPFAGNVQIHPTAFQDLLKEHPANGQ